MATATIIPYTMSDLPPLEPGGGGTSQPGRSPTYWNPSDLQRRKWASPSVFYPFPSTTVPSTTSTATYSPPAGPSNAPSPPASYTTDASRWRALCAKDPAAANAFVYAVLTTGIYCRPTCPARLARRVNIKFFDSAVEAKGAGFRACKRCKPETGDGMPEDGAITAVKGFVEKGKKGDGSKMTLKQMADEAGLSKWHFHRVFNKVMGITPGEWVRRQQKERDANTQAEAPQDEQLSVPEQALQGELTTTPVDSTWGFSTGNTPANFLSPSTSDDSWDFNIADFDFPISEEEWQTLINFDMESGAIGQGSSIQVGGQQAIGDLQLPPMEI